MHSRYHSSIIRQLRDQQVRFAPREKKVEQVNRAEKLLAEIDEQRTYSYEYLCYRITDFRPEASPGLTMSGEQAHHDLRLFVEDVSDAANIRADEVGEPVLTVEELSRSFNVSAKTIARWRQQGLVSRRFIFDSGRKRVGFLNSSIERFVSRNPERVRRGTQFSQLSERDRDEIVRRARRLVRRGAGPSDVSRRLARNMNRSIETIRYTLKQFDEKHPHMAVFPGITGPLTEEAKGSIYQQHRRGVSVDALAAQHSRTKTSIYRVVNEMRSRRIFELPLEYIYNESFDRPGVAPEVFATELESDYTSGKSSPPQGLPPYLAALYENPLLSREGELRLFHKFNFLKYKCAKLREQLDPAQARTALMDEIEQFYDQAVEVKNRLVRANLRLVVSIAKRHVNATNDLFSLVSDGNMSLFRAVEKFDYSRGNKFSTYCSWAIMKNFARSIPAEFKLRDRFRTSQTESFAVHEDERSDESRLESAQNRREHQIDKILSCLDEREQKIIISRFGLDYGQEPQTLREIGNDLGVTKERIRQIEARALAKLRSGGAGGAS